MDELAGSAKRAVQAGVVLIIGFVILSSVFGLTGFMQSTDSFSPAPAGDSTQIGTTGSTAPDYVDVSLTRGNALMFNGGDRLAYGLPESIADGASVCATPTLKDTLDKKGAYVATAGVQSNTTLKLRYSNQTWEAYAATNTSDALATVPASSPTSPTPICAAYNETAVTVFANGNSDTDTLDSTTSVRQAAVDWRGPIDEVRWFNASISESVVSQYQSEPVEPLPADHQVLRLMLDEGSGPTTTAHYADYSSVDIGSATWTSGLSGPGLSAGSDYVIETDPFRIATVSDGALAGAPVGYVTTGGPFYDIWVSVTGAVSSALALLGLSILVLGANSLGVFDGTRGGL